MLPRHMIAALNGQISGLTVSSDNSPGLCNLVRANAIALELTKDLYGGWFLCHDSICVLYTLYLWLDTFFLLFNLMSSEVIFFLSCALSVSFLSCP